MKVVRYFVSARLPQVEGSAAISPYGAALGGVEGQIDSNLRRVLIAQNCQTLQFRARK